MATKTADLSDAALVDLISTLGGKAETLRVRFGKSRNPKTGKAYLQACKLLGEAKALRHLRATANPKSDI